MKILQIAPAWIDTPPSGYGGTEAVISNLTESLVDLGHDVTLFATGNSKTSGKLKYVYKKSFRDQEIDWKYALPAFIHYNEAFEYAKRNNFDIVHIHLSSDTDPILMGLAAYSNLPVLMTIHGHFPFDRVSNTDDMNFKLYAKDIPVTNISKTMEEVCPKDFFRVGVVYNGVDYKAFKPNYKYDEKGYLTWLGKIVPDKGTHEAILAAKKAGERIIFAGIVDEAAMVNGEKISVKYFKEKVEPLIDGDQVQFIGPADFKTKSKLLAQAKGFLNPIAWKEPFGLVMVESMACGSPVIAYPNGAAKELIKDGKTGYFVKDVDEMAKAIKKLNVIDRKDCRNHVVQNFSIEAMTQNFLKIYEKVIFMHQQNTAKTKAKSNIKKKWNFLENLYPNGFEEVE